MYISVCFWDLSKTLKIRKKSILLWGISNHVRAVTSCKNQGVHNTQEQWNEVKFLVNLSSFSQKTGNASAPLAPQVSMALHMHMYLWVTLQRFIMIVVLVHKIVLSRGFLHLLQRWENIFWGSPGGQCQISLNTKNPQTKSVTYTFAFCFVVTCLPVPKQFYV